MGNQNMVTAFYRLFAAGQGNLKQRASVNSIAISECEPHNQPHHFCKSIFLHSTCQNFSHACTMSAPSTG
jgi:hypothetical protein